MRKKYGLIIAGVLLFIFVNILLIGIDKDHKVARLAYIANWTALQQKDLHESYKASGVVRYADESNVYFDKNLGNFNEFLVDKGQEVNSGDPLFSYYVNDYDQAKTMLEQKSDLLEQEILAIETAIGKVQSGSGSQVHSGDTTGVSSNAVGSSGLATGTRDDSQIGSTLPGSTGDTTKNTNLEAEMNKKAAQLQSEFESLKTRVEDADSEQAKVLKEQYIAEKEKERDQKEAEQKSIQSQISELSSEGNTITVESPYSGRVTDLSKELKAPLLTIQDPDTLQIGGEITEKERTHTEKGMQATVSMQESNATFEGEISELSEDPTDIKVNGLSLYPFTVNIKPDEKAERLLPGYHANLNIITKIVPDALAAKEKALFDRKIWVMSYKGKLISQKAETGLTESGWVELKNELQPGEWLAVAPKRSLRQHASFITPLRITKLGWLDLQTDKKSNLKYLITGLLSR